MINNQLKIIIYPHIAYIATDGGINVQFYLAKCLKEQNINVKIYNNKGVIENKLFNEYCDYSFYDNETFVIYCEGVLGNPLNAKKVVRWMLSELGQNVDSTDLKTWGKNELVYFYGSEVRFNNNPEYINIIYKTISVITQNSLFKNNNNSRTGSCHTFRKSFIHNTINFIHQEDSIEIFKNTSLEEIIEIFNNCKIFISYDPITYLNTIAALCGCISIVYPLENFTKKQWLQKTHMWNYLEENNLGTNIYGIAYGIEEIDYAISTLHLVEEQQKNITDFLNKKSVNLLLSDISNFSENINTIENVYYNYINVFNVNIINIKKCISVNNIDFTDIFINLLKNNHSIILNDKNFENMSYKMIIHTIDQIYEFNKNSILIINNK